MLDDNTGTGGAGGAGDGGQQQQPAGVWHQGFDADTTAYIQAKKLDGVNDWREAFKSVAQFHRDAENFIGIPQDQRVRAPNPADPASVKAFWTRFGVPEAPDKYDLSGVKFTDGSELDPNFVQTVREAAYKHNIPAEAAQAFARDFTGFLERQDAAEEAATKEALAASQTALRTLWGPNYQANLQLADQAAKRLGVDVDTAALLAEKVGADKVLEMFRKIGMATREDTFVSSVPRPGDGPAMTVAEGKAQLDALIADKEFGNRMAKNDAQALKEWEAAHRAAYPDLYAAAGV